jgi:hypothetical protein
MNIKPKIKWSFLIILAGLVACNLPGQAPRSPQVPAPNLTLTALFGALATQQALPTTPPAPFVEPTLTPTALPTQPPATPTPTFIPTTAVPPTATTAPTKTAISYAGPGKRSGPSVVAYYLQREPTIDGVFDEWDLERYPVTSVVFGKSRWGGADDLSATVMVGWDDNYLYIAARVKDDHYVQGATGKNLFKGDSVEILLDVNVAKDYYLAQLNGDDYQIGISPGATPGTSPEAYLWYPKSKEGSYQTIKIAATTTDNGYRVEAKIPWEIFGIKPNIGQHYGFAFSVSDNDKSGENVQQSMVSNVPGRTLTDPTTWGDLTLRGVAP